MFYQMLFLTGDSDAIVKRLSRLSKDAIASFTELYISAARVDDGIVEAVRGILLHHRGLGVHIAHCTGQVDELMDAVYASGTVRKLTLLTHLRCLTFGGRGLTNDRCMKKLAIQAPISDVAARVLGEGLATCHNLQDFSISVAGITFLAANALAEGFKRNTSLLTLKLIRCGKQQHGSNANEEINVNILVRSLKKHPSLTKLVLQSSACTTAGISAVAALLKCKRCKLKQLELINYRFHTETLPHLDVFLNALRRNRSLRRLSLAGHELPSNDVSKLSMSIATTMLEELCLTNCGINDVSTCILSMWLHEMEHLKRLHLKDNPILFGARELLQSVKAHWELEEVQLPNTNRMKAWQDEIAYYLLLNAGGRRLLREHDFPASLWPKVLSRAEQHGRSAGTIPASSSPSPSYCQGAQADIIYHLLQGPAGLNR